MSEAAANPGPNWNRAALVAVVLLAMVALLFVKWKTRFYTRLTTTHVQFTAAASRKSAGLFNSAQPVELTVTGFERIEDGSRARQIANTDSLETCTFPNANLSVIDMTSPTRVSLESIDGALVMKLGRNPTDAAAPFVSLKSAGPASCLEDARADLSAPEWNVYGRDRNSMLTVTLRPASGSLTPEKEVLLDAGSDVTFWTADNTSGILESGVGLRLSGLERTLNLDEGQWLELKKLQKAAFQSIEFSEKGIGLALRGTADRIFMEEGDVGATVAEVLGGNPEVAKFLVFGAAIVSLLDPLGKVLKRVMS